MNSQVKTLAIAVLAVTVLGAGSAVALKTKRDNSAAPPGSAKLLYTQGFANGRSADWDCSTHSWTVKSVSFAGYWNGSWEPTTNNTTAFVHADCKSGWSSGYVAR